MLPVTRGPHSERSLVPARPVTDSNYLVVGKAGAPAARQQPALPPGAPGLRSQGRQQEAIPSPQAGTLQALRLCPKSRPRVSFP